jgi:hypothetical protein
MLEYGDYNEGDKNGFQKCWKSWIGDDESRT